MGCTTTSLDQPLEYSQNSNNLLRVTQYLNKWPASPCTMCFRSTPKLNNFECKIWFWLSSTHQKWSLSPCTICDLWFCPMWCVCLSPDRVFCAIATAQCFRFYSMVLLSSTNCHVSTSEIQRNPMLARPKAVLWKMRKNVRWKLYANIGYFGAHSWLRVVHSVKWFLIGASAVSARQHKIKNRQAGSIK